MPNYMPDLPVTRLAPSPSGLLHLGNIWSFLLAWLGARSQGGKVYLRIDDIDPVRSSKEHAEVMQKDLLWLGLDWDRPDFSCDGIIYQSNNYKLYASALAALARQKLTYPCFCSRNDLRRLASAPHVNEYAPAYPGFCRAMSWDERKRLIRDNRKFSIRVRQPLKPVIFEDLLHGKQNCAPEDCGGDFPVKRSDGVWAYHLANVVDDEAMGVNLVVRGRDLLASTPSQIILQDYLNYRQPTYAHVPLLLDWRGERLAKRHKSCAIESLREKGIKPGKIIAMLASMANLASGREECSPQELLEVFDWRILPTNDIMTPENFMDLLSV